MIREAGPADLPALAARVWWAHYVPIIGAAQVEHMLARMYDLDVMARELAAGVRYLRLDGAAGAPIAFAAFGPDLPIKLHKLYVDPDHQRAGHGRRLLARVEEAARARRSPVLTLNVNKRNAAAIAAYERCGFRVAAGAVIDIGGGFVMDDWIMEKPLRDRDGDR